MSSISSNDQRAGGGSPLGTARLEDTQPVAPPAPQRFDVEVVRKDFPVLAQEVHGHPLAYLDSAATSLKPRAVIDAVEEYYRRDSSNVHRGVYALAERATARYEAARETVRRFLGVSTTDEVIFTRGTTSAINLVARSFAQPRLGPGKRVLVTGLEHHSNIVPWQLVCEAAGASLSVAPIDDRGEVVMEEFARLVAEPGVVLASVAHVSNALGTVNPVAEMARLAAEHGVPVLVDGAQGAPHLELDLPALGCDFYAFSGHKVMGPTGVGVLWGRGEHLAAMPPLEGGGDMIRSVSFEKTTYADPPMKFEAGTPNIAGVIGLGAALEYIETLGRRAIEAHEGRLLAHATEVVGSIPGVRIIGEARAKASVLSFVMDDAHPHDIGTILDHEGIAVRAGHHCAQPVMDRLGVPATARASFALYNTHAEVERLAGGIERVKEIFGS